MGPPNVLGLPNPASSISTTKTFGAPSGGSAWPISSQSGVESASVFPVAPVNGARRMGRLLRSMVSSLMGAPSGVIGFPGSRTRRGRGDARRDGAEALCQVGRERPGLFAVVGLEVGRRDLQAEVACAVLACTEVAEEREQRSDLTAGERKVDGADVFAALLGAELPDGPQVDAPVTSADHVGGEARAVEQAPALQGLQERSAGHVGLHPPGRRADADEVVFAFVRLVGYA